MKKKILSIIILLSIFGLFLGVIAANAGLSEAFNEDTLKAVVKDSYEVSDSSNTGSIENIISSLIRLVLALLGLIFILLIFLAADLWMKANGNPDKVIKAKKMISQALIGLSFVIIAFSLSYALTELFGNFILK